MESHRIIDVSVPIDARLPLWPADPPFKTWRFLDRDNGDAVNASAIACSVHTGSHVDAPVHHIPGGAGVDQLPLEQLIGPAYVVGLPDVAAIGPAELQAVPAGSTRVLFKRRNSAFWSNRESGFRKDYVAVTPQGAQVIVEREIRLVGVDYTSVEPFDADGETHRQLLGAGVVVVEGLDLRRVQPGRYTVICLPMKITEADGAPARVVLLHESRPSGSA